MKSHRRFVFLELNEVPIRVVRHFAERHPRSSFARLLERGRQFDTVTPDEGHLSPWTTWPTLHRGVSGKKHGLVALGQDHSQADQRFPPVWSILAAAGRKVGMFGSLHSYPLPDKLDGYDFYVPDTFAASPETKPAELSAFQRFNLEMVDRSGRNVSSEVPVKDALTFLLRSVPAGLRPSTLAKVARQVASERIWKYRASRRRTIQSLLAFDLFLAQLQSKKPDASFFFTNHVASSMHRFWPATFLDDYSITKWTDSWVRRFSEEIDYVMVEADQMLAELMAFADDNPDYLIMVSGSMGQAAVDDPERQLKTEVLVKDMGRLLGQLEIDSPYERRRTMAPTYTLVFNEESGADSFMEALSRVRIAGQPVQSRRLDSRGVEFVLGQSNLSDEDFTLLVGNRMVLPEEMGLENVPNDDQVGAAAYHVPEGMLLVYDPLQRSGEAAGAPVSTARIAPTLLALQAVDVPAYMEKPIGALLEAELEPA